MGCQACWCIAASVGAFLKSYSIFNGDILGCQNTSYYETRLRSRTEQVLIEVVLMASDVYRLYCRSNSSAQQPRYCPHAPGFLRRWPLMQDACMYSMSHTQNHPSFFQVSLIRCVSQRSDTTSRAKQRPGHNFWKLQEAPISLSSLPGQEHSSSRFPQAGGASQ